MIKLNHCNSILRLEFILPKYDFLCSEGCVYESEESFGSARIQKCKKCKNGKAERQLNVPTFRYRGMGFYTTDSRKDFRKPEELPNSSARKDDPPKEWPDKNDTLHGTEKKQKTKSEHKEK
ncbi:MAG: putative nucleic acid-binding protein, contains Zn-ribbon domain [Chloroflexi bacterium]|jgi:predicted nucleic acid-binding Zn ribbon protein|nr:MAG: putative nucleic acid-binding protein, contains Zn-ribbon domain [Chloroflexota bacterium]|tara:strand:- start:4157 stop:4519 length:363 start_codon:yes stop_codon:yes gene_type:complete